MEVLEVFRAGLQQLTGLAVLMFVLLGASLLAQFARRKGWLSGSLPSYPEKSMSLGYIARSPLLSPAEATFYSALKLAVPDVLVFAKVRVEDLVQVEASRDQSALTSARNRIKSRHVDFTLCDPKDFSILCGIELDDSSHQTQRAQRSDSIKNQVFRAAGLPLLRFQVRAKYDTAAIERRVRDVAGIPLVQRASLESESMKRDLPRIDWDSHKPLQVPEK